MHKIAMAATPMLLMVALYPSQSIAGEVKTYSYDALGRLTTSSSTGTVNNGVVRAITYDAADNRATYSISGAPFMAAAAPTSGMSAIGTPESQAEVSAVPRN